MRLRTWAGSTVDTSEYEGPEIYWRVALGWARHLRLHWVILLALALGVVAAAFAQRAAGTYDPALTEVRSVHFLENSDGGQPCLAVDGRINTEAGVSEAANITVCPRTAAEANRVANFYATAASLVNKAGRVADGGL